MMLPIPFNPSFVRRGEGEVEAWGRPQGHVELSDHRFQ